MWRNPQPWKNSPETPNIGTWAQTDDTRVGMQLEGLMHLRDFVHKGGVLVAATSSANLILTAGLPRGVTAAQPAATTRVVGTLLRTTVADEASPIMYGIPANLAVYSDRGASFNVAGAGAAAAGAGGGGAGAARRAARAADAGRTRQHARDRSRHARRSRRGAGPAGQPRRSHAERAADPDADSGGGRGGDEHPGAARSSGRASRCASRRIRTSCSSRACSTAAPTSPIRRWSSTCPSRRATSCSSPTTRSIAARPSAATAWSGTRS